jgi:hypothetical protein
MGSDVSRERFDPANDFAGVLLQQGRVLLDADWNEAVRILDRRLRAETTDIIGRATVPKETPHGFEIGLAGGQLTIGPGRIYVHGLLAENHGKEADAEPPRVFDPVLAEEHGPEPIPYDEQPYFPEADTVAPAPGSGGPHLVYLDVWEREVTRLEDPSLVESAVGVDTTTRMQTAWQVRVLEDVGAGTACATPDGEVPGWLELTRPSAGRLSTGTADVEPSDDPCLVPPTGGYQGLDNRLYRVEIHSVDESGAATFKWARHNASVASAVGGIQGVELRVELIGRDAELRFGIGDWVEVTDDVRELSGRAGEIRRVDDVSDTARTITLDAALPAADFPTDGAGNTIGSRHTRIRRWAQQGEVVDTTGATVVDLDAPGSAGVIPVPAEGTKVVLEDRVWVEFSLVPDDGRFRVGDYWLFAARTADASVEELDRAVPRGIHHHYCRLAILTFPGTVEDCRELWPPDFGHAGCDCTVCVTADSHNRGTLTIQQALDQVRETGGTVCLGVGIYDVGKAPVRVEGARSVRLRGQGWKTVLAHVGPGPAVIIDGALGFAMEGLSVLTARAGAGLADVALVDSALVTIERCFFLQVGSADRPKPALGLGGFLAKASVRSCVFFSGVGIGNLVGARLDSIAVLPAQQQPLATLGLTCEDNTFLCPARAVSLGGLTLHFGPTRLERNFVSGARSGGFVMTGAVLARAFGGSGLAVAGNSLRVEGDGIVVGTDDADITGNDVGPASSRTGGGGDGIALDRGLAQAEVDRCRIAGNRILGLHGNGIALRVPVGSAMIKQNVIEGVRGHGIAIVGKGAAVRLTVENNHLLDVAGVEKAAFLAGIHLVRVRDAEVAGNLLDGVGLRATVNRLAGIQAVACASLRIAGNRVVNVGPPEGHLPDVSGIAVLGTFSSVSVADNVVRRSGAAPSPDDNTLWRGVRIGEPRARGLVRFGSTLFLQIARGVFVLGDGVAAAIGPGPESAGVRGNHVEVSGSAPAVEIAVAGPCLVSDNRLALPVPRRVPVPTLRAQAAQLVVSANHVQGERDSVAVQLQARSFTVLGNFTVGTIQVNGLPLGAPWAPLNVQTA